MFVFPGGRYKKCLFCTSHDGIAKRSGSRQAVSLAERLSAELLNLIGEGIASDEDVLRPLKSKIPFELHESRNQHKSYLTRKSSSVRGALITNDGEIGLESKATSASQKATIINQQIENDMSEYGHMRIKIPIINNFE